MLGHVVCRVLSRKHDVMGTCRGPRAAYPSPEWMQATSFSLVDEIDLANPQSWKSRLPSTGISVVVNCAGVIKQRPEAENAPATLRTNGLAPHWLSQWCDAHGAHLIQISTDCVFSGRRGHYSKSDVPDTDDLYGLSKLLGEVATGPHLTLRTSLIGPQLRGQEGLFAWFLAQRGSTVHGYAKAVFSGLTTLACARLLEQLLLRAPDLHGLYHVASAPISKYALLAEIERRLSLGIEVVRDESVVCDRSLDGSRFAAETGIAVPPWNEMLDRFVRHPQRWSPNVDGTQEPDDCLAGRHVLIVGGTGSLGGALVRRLLSARHGRPSAITVFSRDEYKQFNMRAALERHVDACRLRFRLGDIRDLQSVKTAMRAADVVFHAAALKQVPQCEYNPVEAVQTNVMGAANLTRAAGELGVEAVIAASTDKACHPTNVMGMTKALQERVLIAANLDSPGKRFMCARYGNVLGSRGSVFDTFRAQVEGGVAVTLTCRDMTRFVVTLEHAVDAMISVYRFGRAGEIFVPRAAGVRIATLAESLIGDRTIPMIETGVRPGEKIHEVLISQDEISRASERHGYYVLAPMLQELAHEKPAPLKAPFRSNDRLLDRAALDRLLRRHGLLGTSDKSRSPRRMSAADELARAQA